MLTTTILQNKENINNTIISAKQQLDIEQQELQYKKFRIEQDQQIIQQQQQQLAQQEQQLLQQEQVLQQKIEDFNTYKQVTDNITTAIHGITKGSLLRQSRTYLATENISARVSSKVLKVPLSTIKLAKQQKSRYLIRHLYLRR